MLFLISLTILQNLGLGLEDVSSFYYSRPFKRRYHFLFFQIMEEFQIDTPVEDEEPVNTDNVTFVSEANAEDMRKANFTKIIVEVVLCRCYRLYHNEYWLWY